MPILPSAVLPAHAFCLEGNGEEAVRIAALGSACAMVIAVPLSVVCFFLLPALQPYFDWWIGILLIASIGYMIVMNEAPGWALAIFLVSGILGIFALHYTVSSAGTFFRKQRNPDASPHRVVRHFCSRYCVLRDVCQLRSSAGSEWRIKQ